MEDLAAKINAVELSASKRRLTLVKMVRTDSCRSLMAQWIEKVNEKDSVKHIKEAVSEIKLRMANMSALDSNDIKFDILRLIVCREYGWSPKFALQYVMQGFQHSNDLRSLLYMTLPLFEYQFENLPEYFFRRLETDLIEHNVNMLKWLACTTIIFHPDVIEKFIAHFKSLVFYATIETNTVVLASAVLLNLSRTHGASLRFTDVLHRYALYHDFSWHNAFRFIPVMTRDRAKTSLVSNLALIAREISIAKSTDATVLAPLLCQVIEKVS